MTLTDTSSDDVIDLTTPSSSDDDSGLSCGPSVSVGPRSANLLAQDCPSSIPQPLISANPRPCSPFSDLSDLEDAQGIDTLLSTESQPDFATMKSLFGTSSAPSSDGNDCNADFNAVASRIACGGGPADYYSDGGSTLDDNNAAAAVLAGLNQAMPPCSPLPALLPANGRLPPCIRAKRRRAIAESKSAAPESRRYPKRARKLVDRFVAAPAPDERDSDDDSEPIVTSADSSAGSIVNFVNDGYISVGESSADTDVVAAAGGAVYVDSQTPSSSYSSLNDDSSD